jgi:hypothetical protein
MNKVSAPSASSIDHLQVLVQSHSSMASKCISKLARLRPPISLNHGLQVQLQTRSIMASNCISNSLEHGLQVFLQLARLRPPSKSANSLYYSLRVYLQTHLITASKFAPLWHPTASPHTLDHGLQVHIQLARSRPPSVSPNPLKYRL